MTPTDSAQFHWANYPEFYSNPMIMTLASKPRWTANTQTADGKGKMPISIDMFRDYRKIVGCTMPDEPDTPSLTTLSEIQGEMPLVNHHTFRLHNPEDGVICLDVEKTCPDELKRQFLNLPYVYGEVSLSGKGYHLFLPYPTDLMREFPAAQTKIQIKGPDNHYEFLINRHFVTFTRRMLKPSPGTTDPDAIMRPLWAAQTVSTRQRSLDPDVDLDDVPQAEYILRMLSVKTFKKTVADYDRDESRYDLALARFTYNCFIDLVSNWTFKNYGYLYTDDDAVAIVSRRLHELRPERNDKKGDRNGMPWLAYQTSYMLSSNDKTTEETIQAAWDELDKRRK